MVVSIVTSYVVLNAEHIIVANLTPFNLGKAGISRFEVARTGVSGKHHPNSPETPPRATRLDGLIPAYSADYKKPCKSVLSASSVDCMDAGGSAMQEQRSGVPSSISLCAE
jgi:hypothetical protein